MGREFRKLGNETHDGSEIIDIRGYSFQFVVWDVTHKQLTGPS